MNLIDTHFHLDYYYNHQYWYNRISDLQQYTICVTNLPEIYYSCKKLYHDNKYISFALGYNPQQSLQTPLSKSVFLHEFSDARYIGEVGLDFTKKYVVTKQKQIDAFEFICHETARKNKILSVHSRLAEEDTLRILRKHKVVKAIIHWYTGSLEHLRHFIDSGYYFSVNASMCVSTKGRKTILSIPTHRLLVESDGPFSKVDSKMYTPDLLYQTYSALGDVIGINDISSVISANFERLILE